MKIVRRRSRLAPFAMVYGPMVLDGRLSDGAFRALMLLDLLAGADGEGEHSHGLIAKILNVSEDTIERRMSEIEPTRLVTVERRNGRTNHVVIEEPEEVYGRDAITGFFLAVREASTTRRNAGGTTRRNAGGTTRKNAGQSIVFGADGKEQSPSGAPTPSASLPEEAAPGALPNNSASSAATPTAERASQDSAAPTCAQPTADGLQSNGVVGANGTASQGPPRSERGGSGLTDPNKAAETPGRRRGVRKKGLYDPDRPLKEWQAQDAIGYFRLRFQRAWPGEGAPDVQVHDLVNVKGRLTWLDNEPGCDRGIMREVLDWLFDRWGDGLPARIRWKDSRPALALLTTTRLFEALVRDWRVRGKVGIRHDEYDAEEAKKYPTVGWGPMAPKGPFVKET